MNLYLEDKEFDEMFEPIKSYFKAIVTDFYMGVTAKAEEDFVHQLIITKDMVK